MTIDIIYSEESPLINRGLTFHDSLFDSGDSCRSNANWNSSGHVVYRVDLFASIDGTVHFWYPFPAKSLAPSLRMISPVSVGYEKISLSYPTKDQRHLDGEYDKGAYGNIFHDAYSVLYDNFIGRDSFHKPSLVNEHVTRHANFHGELRPKMIPLARSQMNVELCGGSFPNTSYFLGAISKGQVTTVNPLRINLLSESYYTSNKLFELIPILDRIKSYGLFLHNVWAPNFDGWLYDYRWDVTVSNLIYQLSGDGVLECTYHMDVVDTSHAGTHWSWDSRFKLEPYSYLPIYIPFVGGIYSFSTVPIAKSTFICTNYNSYGGVNKAVPTSFSESKASVSSAVVLDHTLAPTTYTDVGREWASSKIYSSLLHNIRANFVEIVQDEWSNILPSSSFSTADALGRMIGSVDDNTLQTLYKIPAISTSLPKVREAVAILGKIVKRDLSFSTLREILDLASSTQLQASFSWRPYYKLLKEFMPLAASALPYMLSSKHLEVGRGSFTFEINDDLGREKVTLVTRSKVVVDITLSGLFSAALTLDSIGIMPRPSRVWDLLPFTFVVNWFTGINRIMYDAESIGISALVPATYVHSYSLSSPLMGYELDTLGVSTTGNREAILKLYARDISYRVPFPKYSRFPFGVPTQLPSSGLIGSLLYQLFLKG